MVGSLRTEGDGGVSHARIRGHEETAFKGTEGNIGVDGENAGEPIVERGFPSVSQEAKCKRRSVQQMETEAWNNNDLREYQ